MVRLDLWKYLMTIFFVGLCDVSQAWCKQTYLFVGLRDVSVLNETDISFCGAPWRVTVLNETDISFCGAPWRVTVLNETYISFCGAPWRDTCLKKTDISFGGLRDVSQSWRKQTFLPGGSMTCRSLTMSYFTCPHSFNTLWLTGLKAPTNWPTNISLSSCQFFEVFLYKHTTSSRSLQISVTVVKKTGQETEKNQKQRYVGWLYRSLVNIVCMARLHAWFLSFLYSLRPLA